MIKESFVCKVNQLPDKIIKGINYYLEKALDKLVTVSVQIQIPTRTILQNKYYWGVIIKCLSEEIGYKPEVMHDYMKRLFLGFELFDMPDGETYEQLKSTKNLNTVKAEKYFREIRNWSETFLNCLIPLPNETLLDYTKYENIK